MNLQALSKTATASRLDRRRMLRGSGALAGAAALLAVPTVSRAHEALGTEAFDMACDGRTFQLNRRDQSDPSALPVPGDTFIVFGSLYPDGTIDKGFTGPDKPGAIGRWICRGTFIVDGASGMAPHVITTVVHLFGDGLSATTGEVGQSSDAIVTEGPEGGVPETRSVIMGGYGKYTGMRGEMIQTFRGDNDTFITLTPEVAVPAPNYTFTFMPV